MRYIVSLTWPLSIEVEAADAVKAEAMALSIKPTWLYEKYSDGEGVKGICAGFVSEVKVAESEEVAT